MHLIRGGLPAMVTIHDSSGHDDDQSEDCQQDDLPTHVVASFPELIGLAQARIIFLLLKDITTPLVHSVPIPEAGEESNDSGLSII
ncbi:MAG: hypothetical protein ABI479_02065 [Gallionella sp.]